MKRQPRSAYTKNVMRLLVYNIRYGVGDGTSSAQILAVLREHLGAD